MAEVQPFGDNFGVADPDLGQQFFLGLTVVDFSCNSGWGEDSQCTINLIQDPELEQYLDPVVVGSPQYFEIVDLSNNPIFRFYGLLQSIERSVNSNDKQYTVTLSTPLDLLQACSVITDVFPGYGGAIEAVHPNIAACLDFASYNSNTSPANVFNVLNAYGVYENDSYGLSGAGFGKSAVNDEGMRVDFYSYAVNELVNGNTLLTPQLGSNIIYGADAYTNSNAYAYNFDINGFLSQIATYIPDDFRVTQSTGGTLYDFVNALCDITNHVFLIDLLKPTDAGSQYFAGEQHVTQYTPLQTHANTVYGGQIRIITQNRNVLSTTKFPLSKTIIAREASDKLGGDGQTSDDLPLDIGVTGSTHPDGPPVASSPFGGQFPVEEISGTQNYETYENTKLTLELNDGTLAKYVIGGYQSRVNYISRTSIIQPSPEFGGSTCTAPTPVTVDQTSNILCYWGDIKQKFSNGTARNVPVITPYLDGNSALQHLDIIAIDVSDEFGEVTMGADSGENYTNGAIYDGVYLCSVMELRAAMVSYESWQMYTDIMKSGKMRAIIDYYQAPYTSRFNPVFHSNGNLTDYGRALLGGSLSSIYAYNTAANKKIKSNSIECEQGLDGFIRLGITRNIQMALQMLWKKIKDIGDNHYGQSFVVKMPAYAVKVDNDLDAPLNSLIKSWDLSDNAYLDPVNYGSFGAPQSDLFVSGGRLAPYANFDSGFTSYTFSDTGFTLLQNNSVPLWLGTQSEVTKSYFDFKNYKQEEVVVHKPDGITETVSVKLAQFNKDYLLIPSQYFDVGGYHPNNCSDWFLEVNNINTINPLPGRKSLINLSNGAIQGVNYLRNIAGIADNNLGTLNSSLLPFALVKIKPVFLTGANNTQDTSPSISQIIAMIGAGCDPNNPSNNNTQSSDSKKNAGASKQKQLGFYPMAIMPKAFGIPQQSNRYVYGPWTTDITPIYGGKIEYIQDDSLVPENYILPSSLTIGGSSTSIVSGYAGMNTAGTLIANTVENFNYLFTESASVTIPGLPKVEFLGKSLVDNGPLVTDLQISIGPEGTNTAYGMSGWQPKFGRTNKYILDRLKKIASRTK